jgi:regulator of nonsense transcripts 2
MLASDASEAVEIMFLPLGVGVEGDELVEKDIHNRFKKMCEGYFENVAKKLILKHKVYVPKFPCPR